MDYQIEEFKDKHIHMKYLKFGNGSKTLVIIPGLCVKSIMLTADTVVQSNSSFAENGFKVYVFDRKENQSYPYSIEQMADDTLYVIEKLNLTNLYLYGHSQGGMIAQAMLIKSKNLFNKAVLSATAARVDEKAKMVFEYWIECAKNHDTKALYTSFANKIFTEEFAKQIKDELEAEAKTVCDFELERFIPNTQNLLEFNSLDRLQLIKTPCFVIGSRGDMIFNYALIDELAKGCKAKSYFYDKASHDACVEEPDFIKRILDFFEN